MSKLEGLHLPHLETDPQSVRQRVEAMEKLLEHLFVIPGTRRDVGLDAARSEAAARSTTSVSMSSSTLYL